MQNSIEAIKNTGPAITFILGFLANILFEKSKLRRSNKVAHAKAISEAAVGWYQQLDDLRHAYDREGASENVKFLAKAYTTNRKILPKMLESLSLIAAEEGLDCQTLVKKTEEFLRIVTDYDLKESKLKNSVSCQDLFAVVNSGLQSNEDEERLNRLLEDLDKCLQEIVFQAALIQRV